MSVIVPRWNNGEWKSYALDITLILFLLAALCWLLIDHSQSDLQFVNYELVLNSFRHAALAVPALFFPWLAGIWLVHLTFRKSSQDTRWLGLMGYLFSIPISLLWAVSALTITGGVLLIIPLALLGVLILQKQIGIFHLLKSNGYRNFLFLALTLIFGTLLGVVKHGPTADLWARPHGDFAFYASAIHAIFSAQSFPISDLSFEGSTLYGFNLLFPAMGAALLHIFPLDGFLFLGATGSSYFLLSAGLCLKLVIDQDNDLESSEDSPPFSLLPVFLSMAAISLYPSWVVDSIPMIYSAALTICFWFFLGSRSSVGPNAGVPLTLLTLIVTALTKVVSIVFFFPFAVIVTLRSFKNSSRLFKGFLISVFLMALIYAGFMLTEFGTGFFSHNYFQPLTLVYIECCHSGLLQAAARDLSTILLIALALLRIGGIPGYFLAVSFALGLVMPVLFSSLIGFASLFMALEVWHQHKRNNILVIMFLVALSPGLWKSLAGDPSGLINWVWCVGFLGAFSFLGMFTVFSNQSRVISAYSLPLGLFLLFLATLNVASGKLGVSTGQWQPTALHKALTPEVYDVWKKVSEINAERALIFTDSVGPEVSLLAGWNTYSMHGHKQIYLAQWFQSGFRIFEHPVVQEKMRLNFDVIEGRINPSAILTKVDYKRFFAVVGTERKMNKEWRYRDGNQDFSIYEWTSSQ